ncbi:MAG TPA: heparan-alpha-glucosaminide N-acetyltransferase domain-containing protein, partial [Actinotalea sp.]|nr:heparan-alpha-glucosaminide N-acetyltransferase domain-containing protein [Actinotalea sp.]
MTSGAGRLAGVDVARGLAVLGMATAHVGPVGEDWSRPAGWLQLTDGRSAGLFATLAGVSIGLLSGGEHARDLSSARAKVATRAVLIGLLGLALTSLGTPVAVILPSYAVMFVLMVPVLGVRSRTLAVAAGVVVVVGGTVHASLGYAPWMHGRLASLVVGPFYPVTA